MPEALLSLPALTEKDREDLRFAVEAEVDYIALSFVQRPEDIEDLRQALAALGATIPIIAKIEKPQAVAALPAILATADGIMVARGDLGVELPAEQVPLIQKTIIRAARAAGLPVITATQMLESMVDSPTPTRAEASDVANAVLDGTDAVMLSAETASGAYPTLTAETMARIAQLAEEACLPGGEARRTPSCPAAPITLSRRLPAASPNNWAPRQSSASAAAVPPCANCPAFDPRRRSSPSPLPRRSAAVRRCSGVCAPCPRSPPWPGTLRAQCAGSWSGLGTEEGILASGDTVVVTAALPFGAAEVTNTLRVERVP